jgi:AraC-like DNA-binding protein
MDPLSDVLALLKPRSYACGAIDAGGEVAMRFGPHQGIKCYAMVSGQCWLCVDGVPDAVSLHTGDCFVLPRGWPFNLTTDMNLTPVDAHTLFVPVRDGGINTINGGGRLSFVGGHFVLAGNHADVLLCSLPPIVHIRKEPDKAALRWSLELMMQELRGRQPGGSLIAQQLAYTMLIQALRLHLAEGPQESVGWLFALADKQMGAAINSMHEDPARRWTLQELAQCVGMSRSAFAQQFKETVGESPMEYLTRWRMLLASDRLQNSKDPVAAIALSLGYESESAFSTAFKRVMGCSPRQYGRERHQAAPAPASASA